MRYYCRIDSSGEETNLQLYSIKEAAEQWNELLEKIADLGEDNVPDLEERCVFILNCFGLSLTQLLGQNFPCPTKEEMPNPGELLGSILKRSNVDRTERKRLNKNLQELLSYYGPARHFGQNMENRNYRAIEEITMTKLDTFRKITIEIWDTLIRAFRQDVDNDLDELRSICDLASFNKYTPRRISNSVE